MESAEGKADAITSGDEIVLDSEKVEVPLMWSE